MNQTKNRKTSRGIALPPIYYLKNNISQQLVDPGVKYKMQNGNNLNY